MPVKEFSALGFETRPNLEKFSEEFNELCSRLGDLKATTCTIRQNQEHFMEFHQKCVHEHDPELHMAMENAGDIIRELSKCACSGFCSAGYIAGKVRSLQRMIDDTAPDSLVKRMGQYKPPNP